MKWSLVRFRNELHTQAIKMKYMISFYGFSLTVGALFFFVWLRHDKVIHLNLILWVLYMDVKKMLNRKVTKIKSHVKSDIKEIVFCCYSALLSILFEEIKKSTIRKAINHAAIQSLCDKIRRWNCRS